MRNALPAFSLIETMVSVAIAGVIASVAVTGLLPALRRAEMGSATDSVVGFVAHARMQALTARRCMQLFILDKDADAQQVLVLRELNSFDCDGTTAGHAQTMETAPRIKPSAPLWIEVDKLTLDNNRVAVTFESHPASLTNAEGASCPATVSECRELRFRPTGRIWSPDRDLTNDDVTIRIRHTTTGSEHILRVAGNGAMTLGGGS